MTWGEWHEFLRFLWWMVCIGFAGFLIILVLEWWHEWDKRRRP